MFLWVGGKKKKEHAHCRVLSTKQGSLMLGEVKEQSL